MPLMRDETRPGQGSTDSLVPPPPPNSDQRGGTGPPPDSGRQTRSNSPSTLSTELFLRVQAQNEVIESMEEMLTQVSGPTEDLVLTEVTMMLNELEELHQAFRTGHSWLVSNWPPAHLDHAYFTQKVNVAESRLMLKIKRLLGRLQEQLTTTDQSADSSGTGSRPRSRLPELTVPTSSGDCRKWPEFKAMFRSVIGDRSDLNDLEKFQYLKGAMQGDASELIVNFSPHPASYNAAWKLLDARFENKRLIIKTHLERVLNLKPMQWRQASSLTKMVNIINETTQSLRTLTTETNNDCLMVTLVSGLLDRDTRERWESSLPSTDDFPTLGQLTDFLIARARTLENIEEAPTPAQTSTAKGAIPERASSHQATKKPQASSSQASDETTQQTNQRRSPYPCDCCGQDHFIVMCPKLRDYSLDQRLKVMKERSLCCNCLGRHNAASATAPDIAKLATKLTTLCCMVQTYQPSSAHRRNALRQLTRQQPQQPTHRQHEARTGSSIITITLRRAHSAISVISPCWQQPQPQPSQQPHHIRQLNLERGHSKLDIYGVGGKRTSQTKGVVTVTLHSRYEPLSVEISAHVLRTVTTILPISEPPRDLEWPHLKGLNLADPEFFIPRALDVIIGADYYGQLIKPNIIRHSPEAPIAQLSIFGWLVIGPVHAPVTRARTAHHGVSQAANSSLRELLTRFWVQEEPPISSDSQLAPEEQECEDHFKTTHSRDSTGRYTVRIPLKSSPTALGDSHHTAYLCLQRILKRFERDSQYHQLYTQFMHEYEKAEHMIKLDDSSASRKPHYYLPHHGVLKPDSSTTKLRVVFNGSSASSTGYSLNDLMHAGPNLMLNIFDLLICIRRSRFLFATDITKMYRQIKKHPDDWDLQRILWVDEQHKESHYQLTTVTYGTKAAPFLAVRTLLQLAEDEGSRYPLAVEPITHGRYVDDIFGGSDTLDELTQTAHQLIQLCHAGGFPLAKWHSTSRQLLERVSSELGHTSGVSFDDCDTKVLGIRWSSQQDTFNFSTISSSRSGRITKRLILSEVAQIFDPLGFAAPVVIRAKMFLQALWLQKLDWDDSLPDQLIPQWLSIREDLTSLARLSVPRWFNTLVDSAVELHGFADASQLAMAAVVYMVVNSPSTGANVSLICSRTKVSPLKRLTIPRLELTAALLLSTLINHVSATLNIDITINRVAKIQDLTERAHWRHVPGTSNPADCASRGITTDQLEEHSLWWTGLSWMTQPMASWPAQADLVPDDASAQEARATVALHAVRAAPEYHWDLIYKFSSLNKLYRITSLCSNFIKKLSGKLDLSSAAFISSSDMED